MSSVNVKYFKEIDGVPFLSAEEEKEQQLKLKKLANSTRKQSGANNYVNAQKDEIS